MENEKLPEAIQNGTPQNGTPEYATFDGVLAWKSPDPLAFDYTHSDSGQLFRIEGITKAKERKVIYQRIRELVPNAKALALLCGYEPTEADITDACWCAACVARPKLTAEDWLRAGAEMGIGELLTQAWIASRIVEDRREDETEPRSPDGVEAAKEDLKSDPLD